MPDVTGKAVLSNLQWKEASLDSFSAFFLPTEIAFTKYLRSRAFSETFAQKEPFGCKVLGRLAVHC